MYPRPLGVVTGASTGIGLEFARQLAHNGHDLVIAAHDDALEGAAQELRGLGAQVEAVRVDLATREGCEELAGQVGTRPVAVLALNAGRGAGGEFVGENALDEELEIVDLNCRHTVHVAKRIVPGMVSRGEGRVLVTSSIAATMPGPFQLVYNASKSFTQSFALGLREELADTGVTVTALMPGPTDTEFFERAHMEDTQIAQGADDPATVARQAYEGLMNGDERVRGGGLSSKLQGAIGRVLPDSVKAKAHAKMAEPGSAG